MTESGFKLSTPTSETDTFSMPPSLYANDIVLHAMILALCLCAMLETCLYIKICVSIRFSEKIVVIARNPHRDKRSLISSPNSYHLSLLSKNQFAISRIQ